tara:strand:- start:279 stop:1388 length:1110 start_codon:yes stop_codon:yes gene_type:complete
MINSNFKNTILEKTFKNKVVIITGHTGFKGSWLSIWLLMLGAKVVGISKDIPTKISHFETLKLSQELDDNRINIKDFDSLVKIIKDHQPDFIFHLAAQPLVRKSYEEPIETWSSNLIGTVNILESLKKIEKSCSVVMITSDKCYRNKEWIWGYRENDELGGPDPYSASKGAAELAIRSYFESYYKSSNINLASVRAGNVIGGGDWAEDRIVPDCIRSWTMNEKVSIRNPKSTRPWQHVLEPLSGYLNIATKLEDNSDFSGESFNFGPSSDNNFSVEDLIKEMAKNWEAVKWEVIDKEISSHESSLLKLNCDKSLDLLGWHPTLNFQSTVKFTVDWYKEYNKNSKMLEISQNQIIDYCDIAKKLNLKWMR